MATCKGKNITGSRDDIVKASRFGKEDTPFDAERQRLYRSVIGKLQFTTNERRDLGFEIMVLAQKLASSTEEDESALKSLLQHAQVTKGKWLCLKLSEFPK
eukprot:4898271-Heterocapsa_arctica.AAC.1